MPEPGGHRQGAARAAAEEVPGGAARPAGRDPVLPAERRRCWRTSSGCSSGGSRSASTEHHKIPFNYDDEAVKLIVSRCTEVESGGRMIDAILTNTVLPAISREFLTRTMAGAALNGVRLARGGRRFRLSVRLRRGAATGRTGCARCSVNACRTARQPIEAAKSRTRELTLEEAVSIAIQLQQNDQFAEAEAVYGRILEVAPDHPDALHYRRRARPSAGAERRGVALIERSLALVPDRADWHSNLGIVLQERGRLDEAIAAYQRAIALDPSHANALQQSRRPAAGDGQAGRSRSGVSDRHSR